MYDVIIIGGGLYGTSTAYHLLRTDPALRVCVIERDSGYEHAASARSNGGVRVLFSQRESILMSQYGHKFYADFPTLMSLDGTPATLQLYRHGYLLMASTKARAADIKANYELQYALAKDIDLHDRDSLKRVFPSIRTDDLELAVHSPNDMWIDPYGATTGLRHKARALGAEIRPAAVSDIRTMRGLVREVVLDNGDRLSADWIVNTTGAWAPEVCRMIGLEIPVKALPMMVYYFECQTPVEQFGMTIDIGTVSFRPEGSGFITINHRADLMGSFCWEPELGLFELENWPRLAARIPAFEAVRMQHAYCCHYAFNTFDGNLLLGAWPGMPENFLLATGATGHGLQHAPAAGRALSELIINRRFQTLDLERFGCERVVRNRPDPERGFTA